ncbi:hypothetical protein ACV3RG_12990 [Clostridium perfringens]
MNSVAVHKIFLKESNLKSEENNDIFWDLKCKDNDFMNKFNEKMNIFEQSNVTIVEEESQIIESILGNALKEEIGFNYQELIDILINTVFENRKYGVKKY